MGTTHARYEGQRSYGDDDTNEFLIFIGCICRYLRTRTYRPDGHLVTSPICYVKPIAQLNHLSLLTCSLDPYTTSGQLSQPCYKVRTRR
jgi:hypothetical protein